MKSDNNIFEIPSRIIDSIAEKPVLALIFAILIVVISAAVYFLSEMLLFLILVFIIGIVLFIVFFYFRGERTTNGFRNTIQIASKLTGDQKSDIKTVLVDITKQTANLVGVPMENIRANIFGVDSNGTMRMIEGMNANFDDQNELTVSMPVGYGSSGRCFQRRQPNIAIIDVNWGKDTIEDKELLKVHEDLQWIVSYPIIGKNNGNNEPIWTVNIDGLVNKRNPNDLGVVVSSLQLWAELIKRIAKMQ